MITQRSVVKWFDAKKGYGFIVNPQGGQDIFVHYSQIETDQRFKTLRTGQVVEYQLHDGPKGPHAINVSFMEYETHGPQALANAAVSPLLSEPTEAPEHPLFTPF